MFSRYILLLLFGPGVLIIFFGYRYIQSSGALNVRQWAHEYHAGSRTVCHRWGWWRTATPLGLALSGRSQTCFSGKARMWSQAMWLGCRRGWTGGTAAALGWCSPPDVLSVKFGFGVFVAQSWKLFDSVGVAQQRAAEVPCIFDAPLKCWGRLARPHFVEDVSGEMPGDARSTVVDCADSEFAVQVDQRAQWHDDDGSGISPLSQQLDLRGSTSAVSGCGPLSRRPRRF